MYFTAAMETQPRDQMTKSDQSKTSNGWGNGMLALIGGMNAAQAMNDTNTNIDQTINADLKPLDLGG